MNLKWTDDIKIKTKKRITKENWKTNHENLFSTEMKQTILNFISSVETNSNYYLMYRIETLTNGELMEKIKKKKCKRNGA